MKFAFHTDGSYISFEPVDGDVRVTIKSSDAKASIIIPTNIISNALNNIRKEKK